MHHASSCLHRTPRHRSRGQYYFTLWGSNVLGFLLKQPGTLSHSISVLCDSHNHGSTSKGMYGRHSLRHCYRYMGATDSGSSA